MTRVNYILHTSTFKKFALIKTLQIETKGTFASKFGTINTPKTNQNRMSGHICIEIRKKKVHIHFLKRNKTFKFGTKLYGLTYLYCK